MTNAHQIHANGINFSYLEHGEGSTVFFLHGFPDIAQTWEHQMQALGAAGYRCIAPSLRGYPPTELAADGFFDKATLVKDIAELIISLGGGEKVRLVGQDWGAIIGYALCAAYPELLKSAVLMAVPHPSEVAKSLLNPKHIHRSFHWWFFQQPDLPEQALLENDSAFIDYLWDYWTAQGHDDSAHIRKIKQILRQPGVLNATLAYYRAMFNPAKADPSLNPLRTKMTRAIEVPTLCLCGADDLRAELMGDQAQYFKNAYHYDLVKAAGHFLHRENPTEVNRLIINWFEQY